MKQYQFLLFLSFLILASCKDSANVDFDAFATDEIPQELPIPFKPELVPDNYLIHRGVFSNDLEEYYFTISDSAFSNFSIKVSKKFEGRWSEPEDAFFNSQYSDHGMSFSPDGNKLVFSSTRPVDRDGVLETWHLWQCVKQNGKWTEPEFIDIPNLRTKLVSHPTLAEDGTLYFHSSELDYSEMAIYSANLVSGKYEDAKKLDFQNMPKSDFCTPYISSGGQHLLFAKVGESLELFVCNKNSENEWSLPSKLPDAINQAGQGNPYLTPDAKYLFFAAENENRWEVKWVSTKSFLKE